MGTLFKTAEDEVQFSSMLQAALAGSYALVIDARSEREYVEDHLPGAVNLPVVDNVAIVDQDRRRLTTWVHLTEEANARLAEALKAVIEPFVLAAAHRTS